MFPVGCFDLHWNSYLNRNTQSKNDWMNVEMCTRWFIISDREISPPADSKGCRLRLLRILPPSPLTCCYMSPKWRTYEDIWNISALWVGFMARFLRICFHTTVSPCAFTHTGADRMETQRSKAELGQWSHGGGQVLAEVVVCAVGLSDYPLWRWLRNLLPCWRWWPTTVEWNWTNCALWRIIQRKEKKIYDGLITFAEKMSLFLKCFHSFHVFWVCAFLVLNQALPGCKNVEMIQCTNLYLGRYHNIKIIANIS